MEIRNLVHVKSSKWGWFILYIFFFVLFPYNENLPVMRISRFYGSNEISLALLCSKGRCTHTEVLTWHLQKPVLRLKYLAEVFGPASVGLLCRTTPQSWSGCGSLSNGFSNGNLCSYIWERRFLQSQSIMWFDLPKCGLQNMKKISVNIFLSQW